MSDDHDRFLAVARHRSVSAAARALNISQPALSRSIRMLEDHYRTPLFRRTARGVDLTEAGKTLLLHASRARRALQNAEEEIGHALHLSRRTLRLCCGDSWGYGILPAAVSLFRAEMPDVAVQVDLLEHDLRMQAVDSGNHDIAFGVISPEMLDSGRYEFRPLVRSPYDIYCDARHPLLKLSKPDPADLLKYSWINHKFEYDYDPSSAHRTERDFAHRTNAMLHAIEALRGSSMLISTAKSLAPLFAKFGILRLMEDPESPVFVSGAVLARSASPSRIVRRFLAHVEKHCETARAVLE